MSKEKWTGTQANEETDEVSWDGEFALQMYAVSAACLALEESDSMRIAYGENYRPPKA